MTYLEKAGADLILPPFFHFLHHLKGDFLYDYVFSGSVFAGRRLFTYGRLVERVSRIDDRQAPAVAHPDGVDYVPMKTWRIFLIQLLNIAGLGPIYGALSGACWGPEVYLWIVFGTILGGGVHDFLSSFCFLLALTFQSAPRL